MADQFLNLFCDYRNKRFVQSLQVAAPFQMPSLHRQEKINIKIQFVEPKATGGFTTPLQVVDVTPLSMQMGIGYQANGDPLATQLTWTKDEANNVFTAALDLNTTAMEAVLAALAPAGELRCTFEVMVTEGASRHVVQVPLLVKKAVLYTGAPAPGTYEPPSALVANLVTILPDTDTIDWTQAGNTLLGEVKRKTGGGITKDSNGLYLDPFTEQVSGNIQAGDALTITPAAGIRFHYRSLRLQDTGGTGNADITLDGAGRNSGDEIVIGFNVDDVVAEAITITVSNSSNQMRFTGTVADRHARALFTRFYWTGVFWQFLEAVWMPYYSGGGVITYPKRTVMLDGDTMFGLLQWSGTGHYGLKLNSLTTAQRDALTPADGHLIYNSSDSQVQGYIGGVWVNLGSGGGATPPGRYIDAGNLNEGTYVGLDNWIDWHQTTFKCALVAPVADPATLAIDIGNTGADEGDLIHVRMDCTAVFAEVTTVNFNDVNTATNLVTFTSTVAEGSHFVGTFSYDSAGATWSLVSAHFEE